MHRSDRTLVFLCTYQGESYLEAQIDSILNQTAPLELWVSDDGSTDSTRNLVLRYVDADPRVRLLDGPQQGFVANFSSVFERVAVSDYAYLAFADQDDLWDLDKLARAHASIPQSNSPVLYGSATRLIDECDRVTGLSASRSRRLMFSNALVESFAGGNTMVLNREAIQYVKVLRDALGSLRDHWISHDWMLYLMMTLGEHQVVYDPIPSLGYRQHRTNIIGGNQRIQARLSRARGLFDGRFREMVKHNTVPLANLLDQMTPEVRSCFDLFRKLAQSRRRVTLRQWRQLGLYRQQWIDQRGLDLAVILGRFP